MNKLDELIRQYCPDGVEYKKLSDFATVTRGGNFQKKDFVESGKPCIHYGQIYTKYGLSASESLTFVDEATWEKSKKAPEGAIVMAVTSENYDDVCKCVVWEGKEAAAVSGHTAIIEHNINARYLAYWFSSSGFFTQKLKLAHGTKVIEVTPSALEHVEIPVPPLPVQEEIVRILDEYSELEEELEANLEAELDMRKKQYEYYRDKMLSLEDYDGEVEEVSLDELCSKITDGSHFSPTAVNEGHYMPSVKDMTDKGFVFDSCKQISDGDYETLVKQGCQPQVNDVCIAKDGSMLRYVFDITEPLDIVVLSSIAILRPHVELVLPRYLVHCLSRESFKQKVIEKFQTKGGVPRIILKNFKMIKVAIPKDLSEQKRIVDILDHFDTLTTDISEALPAEIKMRHQQYEYYRDKLLNFKRLEVAANA